MNEVGACIEPGKDVLTSAGSGRARKRRRGLRIHTGSVESHPHTTHAFTRVEGAVSIHITEDQVSDAERIRIRGAEAEVDGEVVVVVVQIVFRFERSRLRVGIRG